MEEEDQEAKRQVGSICNSDVKVAVREIGKVLQDMAPGTFHKGEMSELVLNMDIMPFEADDIIIKEGELASWAGFLVSGSLTVEIGGKEVAVLPSGGTMGEMAVFEGKKNDMMLFLTQYTPLLTA